MVTTTENDPLLLCLMSAISMVVKPEQRDQIMGMMATITGLVPVTDSDRPSSANGVKYLHGIRGLADHLGVSIPTAQKYKDSGILDGAIRRVGRQFNFDVNKVDEVFNSQPEKE